MLGFSVVRAVVVVGSVVERPVVTLLELVGTLVWDDALAGLLDVVDTVLVTYCCVVVGCVVAPFVVSGVVTFVDTCMRVGVFTSTVFKNSDGAT